MSRIREFLESAPNGLTVRGFLHLPADSSGEAIVLTHGAGSNSNAPLLAAVADGFCDCGWTVLRCDLPFRQARPTGPPPPGSAARDQQGLRAAVAAVRPYAAGRIFLGGHSYGGRQASMLAAAEAGVAEGLLLLSYPLHPPQRPEQLRTAHFPRLETPALFVHGGRDGFGSIDELTAALRLIPAATEMMPVAGAGHELLGRQNREELPGKIVAGFRSFVEG